MNNLYYAGIGARITPEPILNLMTKAASALEVKGYTLRSGGAQGADWAFQKGVRNDMHIYIPWSGFQGMVECAVTPYVRDINRVNNLSQATMYAQNTWESRGRNWHSLKSSIKNMMIRNSCQIIGINGEVKSHFVLCWCPVINNIPQGGTAQAIAFAEAMGVPVLNMFYSDIVKRVEIMINK